jgi:phosphodiesterase/alkaline phosphatase D-like protein
MKRRLQVMTAAIAATGLIAGVAAAASSPAVVTGGTSKVTDTSAVLRGTVNPNGSSTTYFFQWGLTTGYGLNGKPLSAGAGVKTISVQQTPTGLIPGTPYHYRLVATNQFGTTVGKDRTFTTAGHPPPIVATGPATAVNASGSTLTGVINPQGQKTTWMFQYGTTTSYTLQTAPPQTIAAGSSTQNVAWSLQGLLASGTIYHYRLVASHASATSYGADGTFMTYPNPRPVPAVHAMTKPHRASRSPYVFTTTGTVNKPSSMPNQYVCFGNLTARFFRGTKQVGFTIAGLQPNCAFSATTEFARIPGRRSVTPVRLRVVIRYLATGYLAGNRASIEHVTLG